MTDAEFAHWLEATRDHSRRREPLSEQGKWYFDSINHPRLIPYWQWTTRSRPIRNPRDPKPFRQWAPHNA
ncbi:hypothetical protein D5R55_19370 [Burkholderia cenocepacia]|uniref:Uncharacterized protein n=2 Tax=Burkholderia cenocepacia TaxID=95486 RepID=A0A3Q9F5L5_9BURK|nr:hypothetical protein D5R55_19370 [Burkholderia cenocepacia]